MTGKIKNIIGAKGYGFIRAANREYFFHASDFDGDFHELIEQFEADSNIEVTFNVVDSPKGPRAGDVRIAGKTQET